MSDTRFFMTHHASVGAWSSFTYGLPGQGVSIDHEGNDVDARHDLVVALVRGERDGTVLPFLAGCDGLAQDFVDENEKAKLREWDIGARWRVTPLSRLRRSLEPSVDTFSSDEIEFSAYTPLWRFSDTDPADRLRTVLAPGILLQVTFDNTKSGTAANGYVGVSYRGQGRTRPIDITANDLCGIAFTDTWALAALAVEGEVFTMRRNSIAQCVERGSPIVHGGGNEGGVLVRVPPGGRRSLLLAFGSYHAGSATQGIDMKYWYTDHFSCVEDVCRHILAHSLEILEQCLRDSGEFRSVRREYSELFAQSVRAYYANTQCLVDQERRMVYNVCEGRFYWRNTIDLAADHLPWELDRHPWAVRSIVDQALGRYSYRDNVRFPGRAGEFPGGLAFCHDMGNYTWFAPPGRSGYEMTGQQSYHYMTTEQVLNAVYLVGAYVLVTGDMQRAYVDAARDLLASLLNRENLEESGRDGVLRATSSRTGEGGHEITTYDCLDQALKDTAGNLYIAVKTWCAALMLEETLRRGGDMVASGRAKALADRCATTLERSFDAGRKAFPPNLERGGDGFVFAAIDPLAVLWYAGLSGAARAYARLIELLTVHTRTCLAPGTCIESHNGGIRLSSGSSNTWPSKVALCLYSAERVLGVAVDQCCPESVRALLRWAQVGAKLVTISDQIDSTTEEAINGFYYPRIVTSYLLVKQ